MSTPGPTIPPDFDEDFLQCIAEWEKRHNIKDDDTIKVLMDLFRIHQNHWDQIRRQEMPSLDAFKKDIAALIEATTLLKGRIQKEIHAVELPTAIFATFAAGVAGYLIGKLL